MFLCHYFPPITRDLIETLFFVCAIWKYFRTSMRDNADWYIFYININNRTIFLCNMHGFRNMHIAPIAPYPYRSIILYESEETSSFKQIFRSLVWEEPHNLIRSSGPIPYHVIYSWNVNESVRPCYQYQFGLCGCRHNLWSAE